jgi:D-alanyl-D-alanine dipeptidase
MDGWKDVRIHDCGEPLEQLGPNERVAVHPIYASRGYPEAVGTILLRSGVVKRLREAAAQLPDGLALLIWDGWRPLALQRRLYDDYRAELLSTAASSSGTLEGLVQMFVSVPSADPSRPSPHLTGGAVDLTLATPDGAPLDMGGDFDELTSRSATGYYDGDTHQSRRIFAERRHLLRRVMEDAAFTNFPAEWWHYDFGDQFWGHITAQQAIYGIAGDHGAL